MYLLTFDIMIFAPYLTMFSSIIFGIIFLTTGYKTDANNKRDEVKISRGWKCVIFGTILTVIFTSPVMSAMQSQDAIAKGFEGDGWSWLTSALLLPIVFLAGNGFIAFCFANGIKFTKRKRIDQNGQKVLDVETATYGCTLLGFGTLFLIASVFYLILTLFPGAIH